MKKTNIITTTNTNLTNNSNTTKNTKGVNTMKKTSKIKTRIIATALSAITVFSAGAMATCTASAAEKSNSIVSQIGSSAVNFFKDKSLGFVSNTALKLIGPELTKVGLTPILNTFLGIEDEGPSNQDILDKIDKSTEEIKAEIAKVLEATIELSNQTANYHQLQMNQLKAINSNIDTKDFRTQADTVAADFAHAIKRIDENKANITCDGSDKINNTTYKAYKEILSDPKCNVSSMQANFDEMLRFLKGQRTSNNNENGYRQLTNYLMDRVVAADLGEHSFTKTPDYYGAVESINAEIRVMEQQVVMDYAIINVLNSMQYRVKEYEIDNGIITVNEDESPFAKYDNTATNLHKSLVDIDKIFNTVLKENASIPSKYVTTDLYVIDGDSSVKKGCTSFIDAWSQGIDSGKNFNIVVLKKGQYLTADAKKGFKFDENVKGLNDKGGFEIPAGKRVYINMCCKSNGFDCSAKKDLDLFTIRNGASLELQSAKLVGDNRKFVIPDNANNT
ncbi:MAG: hypothetical protein UH734_07470, partial [Ruminococcus sp.]|nr:hypothetical protein [Ruminococcus sp.]